MRKLLTFLIALWLSPALAQSQSSPIAPFPPGVFQNRAAIDAPVATNSYVGPGDVLLGASSWWGLLGYPAPGAGTGSERRAAEFRAIWVSASSLLEACTAARRVPIPVQ
jgi:hypothetical protein